MVINSARRLPDTSHLLLTMFLPLDAGRRTRRPQRARAGEAGQHMRSEKSAAGSVARRTVRAAAAQDVYASLQKKVDAANTPTAQLALAAARWG
jgi:hypothetical protein